MISTSSSLFSYLINAWRMNIIVDTIVKSKFDEFVIWLSESFAVRFLTFQLKNHDFLNNDEHVDDIQNQTFTMNRSFTWKRINFGWHRSFNESSLNRMIQFMRKYNFFDLNDAILKNERHAKKLRNKFWLILNVQSKWIFLFNFFHDVFFVTNVENRNDIICIIRQNSFKNDFEMLNVLSSKHLKLYETATIFAIIFDRIIHDILHELNWNNLIVVENMMLTTLLHIDQNENEIVEIANFDIDIYFYELNAKKINVKTKHIHHISLIEHFVNVWVKLISKFVKNSNFFKSNFRLILRSSNVIEFIANYFCRRFQIIFKFQKQFIDVLLKFDLNICVMCFDEIDFLMLSRCARILKIEYNIFIMNFIWNHHLTTRREFEIQKIFKYVNRKFEMRILLNYVRSLKKNLNIHDEFFNNDITKSNLKTLKRIACNVKNFVFRIVHEFDSRLSKTNNHFEIIQNFERLRSYNSYIRHFKL